MLILLSPAKTFAKSRVEPLPFSTTPLFLQQTDAIAVHAIQMTDEELKNDLSLSPQLVTEVRKSWFEFVSASDVLQMASLAYAGMVYKQLGAKDFTEATWRYATDHLLLCSFVYGLLRPTDLIRPYRMEGTVRLESGQKVFEYWRDILTSYLIAQGCKQGGTLLYLASEEMKQLFHWSEVEANLRVIYPNFLVRQPSGKLKQIVIYTKMARGEMARAVLEEQIQDLHLCQALQPAGFVYIAELSDERNWVYIM